ncbi:MAG: hypothetical protein AB7V27_09245 [Candidatus Binatia bacterium]
MRLPRLPKMMIGFVVRRCAVELGRTPSAADFARWANGQNGASAHVFGRPISEAEARVILHHQSRLVTARSAAPEEEWVEVDELGPPPSAAQDLGAPPSNVVSLAAVRANRAAVRGR